MDQRTETGGVLSTWVVVLGSIAIGGHLLAVIIGALAAPSGPWPSPEGSAPSTPPQFAYSLNGLFPQRYLQSLGMASNYHFSSNRPSVPGVSLDVRLKDPSGKELATVHIPEPTRNVFVRHRQGLLAHGLADDQPVEPPRGELIPAPNRSAPEVTIWELGGPNSLVIRAVPQHLVPRDRPVYRPSESSLVLARSYARYLCRVHGAATAEIIRRTQEPIPPAVMFMSGPPPADAAGRLISSFGELSP